MKQDNKLPWFPFYAGDFIAQTIGMTREEKGDYVMLLAYLWLNGSARNDRQALNTIVGGNVSDAVLDKLVEADDGKLVCLELEKLRADSIQKAEKKRNQTAAARAERWAKNPVTDSVTGRQYTVHSSHLTEEQKPTTQQPIGSQAQAQETPAHAGVVLAQAPIEAPRQFVHEPLAQSILHQIAQPDCEAQSRTAPDSSSASLTRADLKPLQQEHYDRLPPGERPGFLAVVAEVRAEQEHKAAA